MAINYGVIGCGAIAQRRHLPEGRRARHANIVAVVDPLEKRVNDVAEQYGARPFTDHKKMLKEADVDAVVVCSPNQRHAQQTVDALRAGKHVLCEKPMATSKRDCKRMIGEAKKQNRHLMVGMNQRFEPVHAKAKELLDRGVIGKPLTFRTAFKHSGPEAWSLDGAKSWFFDPEAAVLGCLGDLGVHKVDLIRFLLNDEFVEAGAIIETLHKKAKGGGKLGLDDNALINLRSKKGAIGHVEVSWTNYADEANETIIFGADGVLRIGADPEFGVVVKKRGGGRECYDVGAMASNVAQTSSGVIEHFTERLRKNRKPEIDGEDAYRSVNVIFAAMDSAKQNKLVKIND